MSDPIEYAACNPHPGFVRFPNGKLVRIYDAQGRYSREFRNESYLARKAAGGCVLPGAKKKQ